jgi:hypothetical protein
MERRRRSAPVGPIHKAQEESETGSAAILAGKKWSTEGGLERWVNVNEAD